MAEERFGTVSGKSGQGAEASPDGKFVGILKALWENKPLFYFLCALACLPLIWLLRLVLYKLIFDNYFFYQDYHGDFWIKTVILFFISFLFVKFVWYSLEKFFEDDKSNPFAKIVVVIIFLFYSWVVFNHYNQDYFNENGKPLKWVDMQTEMIFDKAVGEVKTDSLGEPYFINPANNNHAVPFTRERMDEIARRDYPGYYNYTNPSTRLLEEGKYNYTLAPDEATPLVTVKYGLSYKITCQEDGGYVIYYRDGTRKTMHPGDDVPLEYKRDNTFTIENRMAGKTQHFTIEVSRP